MLLGSFIASNRREVISSELICSDSALKFINILCLNTGCATALMSSIVTDNLPFKNALAFAVKTIA